MIPHGHREDPRKKYLRDQTAEADKKNRDIQSFILEHEIIVA